MRDHKSEVIARADIEALERVGRLAAAAAAKREEPQP
jgi:hypothetical protein